MDPHSSPMDWIPTDQYNASSPIRLVPAGPPLKYLFPQEDFAPGPGPLRETLRPRASLRGRDRHYAQNRPYVPMGPQLLARRLINPTDYQIPHILQHGESALQPVEARRIIWPSPHEQEAQRRRAIELSWPGPQRPSLLSAKFTLERKPLLPTQSSPTRKRSFELVEEPAPVSNAVDPVQTQIQTQAPIQAQPAQNSPIAQSPARTPPTTQSPAQDLPVTQSSFRRRVDCFWTHISRMLSSREDREPPNGQIVLASERNKRRLVEIPGTWPASTTLTDTDIIMHGTDLETAPMVANTTQPPTSPDLIPSVPGAWQNTSPSSPIINSTTVLDPPIMVRTSDFPHITTIGKSLVNNCCTTLRNLFRRGQTETISESLEHPQVAPIAGSTARLAQASSMSHQSNESASNSDQNQQPSDRGIANSTSNTSQMRISPRHDVNTSQSTPTHQQAIHNPNHQNSENMSSVSNSPRRNGEVEQGSNSENPQKPAIAAEPPKPKLDYFEELELRVRDPARVSPPKNGIRTTVTLPKQRIRPLIFPPEVIKAASRGRIIPRLNTNKPPQKIKVSKTIDEDLSELPDAPYTKPERHVHFNEENQFMLMRKPIARIKMYDPEGLVGATPSPYSKREFKDMRSTREASSPTQPNEATPDRPSNLPPFPNSPVTPLFSPRSGRAIESTPPTPADIDGLIVDVELFGLSEEALERIEKKRKAALEAARKAAELEKKRLEEEKKRLEAEKKKREEQERKEALEKQKQLTIIPDLTPEWEKKLDHTLGVMGPKPPHTSITPELNRKDFGTLLPQTAGDGIGWLNDEVVNTYLAKVVQKALDSTKFDKRRAESVPKYHAFSTHLYTTYTKSGWNSVMRWPSRAKLGGSRILKTERVFIPINDHLHWTLIVISGVKRTVEYYDSMGGNPKKYAGFAMKFLKDLLAEDFEEAKWKIVDVSSAQQANALDCGVFVCMNALALVQGREPVTAFKAGEMPMARRMVAATLINGGLSGDFDIEVEKNPT